MGLRLGLTGLAALALAACGEADASGPSASQDMTASQPTGLQLAEAQRETVLAQVAADTENCTLPDGVEREAQVIDLGDPTGGVGALIVTCSVGNRDIWNQLFVVTLADGEAAQVPLTQYDIQGDGQWRAEFAQPNLEWDAENRVFISAIHGPDLCGTAAKWRWDPEARRVALLEQTVQDCGQGDADNLPEPRVVWPTTPPTPEPGSV